MTNNPTDGPLRRVLVATDLSARSDRALDRAASLARQWSAELFVLHVMEPDGASLFSKHDRLPSWRRESDSQRRVESTIRSEISETLPDVSVILGNGDPAEVILQTAEARAADLIVTGVARDELIGRFLLGSTVEKLAGRARVPLLVVRKRGLKPYRHVVTATDFSDASRQAFETGLRLIPGAMHEVFHAYDAPMSGLVNDTASYRQQFREIAEQECRTFLATVDPSLLKARQPDMILEYGAPDQLLDEYAEERNVDLAVLGTHGRGGLYDIVIGSVAKRLLMSLPCDALLVRPA